MKRPVRPQIRQRGHNAGRLSRQPRYERNATAAAAARHSRLVTNVATVSATPADGGGSDIPADDRDDPAGPRGTLVAAVGASPLPAPGLLAALGAAVAVSAITVRADEENRLARLPKANPLPQNRFAMNHRHASSQAGLDNGSGPVAG